LTQDFIGPKSPAVAKDHYKLALQAARDELAELEREKARIVKRISELQQGIVGLSALAGDEIGKKPNSMMDVLAGVGVETGLTDAVRMITSSFGFPMTPKQVRDALLHFGYNLSGYSNILASLHTIMKRLATTGELINVIDDAGNQVGAYLWNPGVAVRRPKSVSESAGAASETRQSGPTTGGKTEEPEKMKLTPFEKRVAERLKNKDPKWSERIKESGGIVLANPPYFADGKRLTHRQTREVKEAIEQENKD
jgi:hypothetical protein